MKTQYDTCLLSVKEAVSDLDLLKLLKYITAIDKREDDKQRANNEWKLKKLKKARFGDSAAEAKNNIINLSSYQLDETEKFILSHGLNFSLPPTANDLKRESIFAEFESLAAQLSHHKAASNEARQAVQASLTDIAHCYAGSPIEEPDIIDAKMRSQCFRALKNLRDNRAIVITRPDKGSGVVIQDASTYVEKMHTILNDTSKFTRLGPVDTFDKTPTVEGRLQRFLMKLLKQNKISKATYEAVRPSGSLRPRLYGLPKVHKDGTPLRPILSMIGSPQHQLSRWLATLLQPVLERYSGNCVVDSFAFAEFIRNYDLNTPVQLCSFDIKSLFTNVPVAETITICADYLFNGVSNSAGLEKSDFIKLMEFAVSDVEFSFNNIMFRQTDGIAMGSPLGPTLANIFVGFYEEQLFATTDKPPIYLRYVDDTFVAVEDGERRIDFEQRLNNLHPNLKFTCGEERDGCLPFLDVQVGRDGAGFTTSVYRKPTFTGEYVRWSSFCDRRKKTNLVKMLVNRALRICSPELLDPELARIAEIFRANGYPDDVVKSITRRTINDFNQQQLAPHTSPPKAAVYLRLPYIGPASEGYRKKITNTVTQAYGSVLPKVMFTSRPILPSAVKDVLPPHRRSNLVYTFKCSCDSSYVGRTSQRLEDRIEQHVPKSVRNILASGRRHVAVSAQSAISQHLLENDDCGKQYSPAMFTIITRGRNPFHLQVLESLHITTKKPPLCKQKQFVYSSILFRNL